MHYTWTWNAAPVTNMCSCQDEFERTICMKILVLMQQWRDVVWTFGENEFVKNTEEKLKGKKMMQLQLLQAFEQFYCF